ncbi:putative peptidase family m28 family protein [Neofusicoccum parvum UCRNP2]|uniref:Peptide hydrolase n=1 Tax=Botryosphaeria parva (strain UCR-NP2) TaxID=1287680 RepID=R1GDH2_BOTPV|nr:putative peptidase family m28 family protein [Neofusicoccum parvum UCRNP2]
MARRVGNPLAFTPYPVTFFVSAIYLAVLASLLTTHHVVPPAPSREVPVQGINLTESWRDLQYLASGFHPYNSHRNDDVRNWLLVRIEEILDRNGVKYSTKGFHAAKQSPVVLYNDMVSNVTFASSKTSTYFEGTNIMVYIRGSEDVPDDVENSGVGGVLVNAHYDSVSTGFGATDDGVGVITVLQLISYFTTNGNQPKRGIVALLNNGEEDWLNGARAFTQHPLSFFPHTFLNLEGAGAGGRATLFRSTDTEITRFYEKAKQPFGSVISADGFKRGLIRSGTDYSVFTADMNMRGLDVAFMEPRAQYHTVEDAARDTSLNSVWHMLGGALETMKGLTSYTGTQFEGEPEGTGRGSNGVWFDLFGETLAVFELHTLFAFSVTLLVVTPLVFIALTAILVNLDKWYLFARKKYLHSSDDDDAYPLYGWRGFFRFPIAFIIATAAVVGLAYLITKVNPNIVYSSQYSVWSMMLSAFFCITWFILRGGAAMRPSALTRTYGLLWIYIIAYALLVLATVAQNNFQLAGVYFLVIYFASAFFALLISYLELFALPKKKTYVQHISEVSDSPGSRTPGIFIGCLIYNLVAFPFSPANKLKVYFIQRVDLDTGINEASLTGLDGFVQPIIAQLPSASGQNIQCGPPDAANRAGLIKCSWRGITPAVVPRDSDSKHPVPPGDDLKYLSSWVQFNASRTHPDDERDSTASANSANITIVGRNTRGCRLFFDPPATSLDVRGASESSRYPHTGPDGTNELRLWSREWERPFVVDVGWDGADESERSGRGRRRKGGKESEDKIRGLDGRAQCIWSDANEKGLIPALDEIRANIPRWAIVSKLADGLVEGTKRFSL